MIKKCAHTQLSVVEKDTHDNEHIHMCMKDMLDDK